jgi:hypothetical protein
VIGFEAGNRRCAYETITGLIADGEQTLPGVGIFRLAFVSQARSLTAQGGPLPFLFSGQSSSFPAGICQSIRDGY